jgi:hypothetical protein
MTVNDHVVRYQEHVSTKSYEELVAAFEETGPDGSGEPTRTLERVRDSENSRAAWEAAVAPLFGPSGFTRCSPSIRVRSSAGTASGQGSPNWSECRLDISRRVVGDVAVPQAHRAAA